MQKPNDLNQSRIVLKQRTFQFGCSRSSIAEPTEQAVIHPGARTKGY
jgi:hypothetical protein